MLKKIKAKLLLVEDDPNLSTLIQDYLDLQGYKVTVCSNGEDGFTTFCSNSFDLCILDIMLPKKDGFSLADDIRKLNKSIPIIFLTAKSFKDDRIMGFKRGCDDYITKPFATEELSLRIDAILRRCNAQVGSVPPLDSEPVKIGTIIFDLANLKLIGPAGEKSLTRKEAELLRLLNMHRNKLLTRSFLLKAVWGHDDYFIGRSMDVFITRLRKYLKDDPSVAITNVHGTGFKLEVPETTDEA